MNILQVTTTLEIWIRSCQTKEQLDLSAELIQKFIIDRFPKEDTLPHQSRLLEVIDEVHTEIVTSEFWKSAELEVETMGNAIEEEEQTKSALAWISSVFPVWRRNELSVDMFGKEWQSLTEDETVALYMANKPIEETIILSETEVIEG